MKNELFYLPLSRSRLIILSVQIKNMTLNFYQTYSIKNMDYGKNKT